MLTSSSQYVSLSMRCHEEQSVLSMTLESGQGRTEHAQSIALPSQVHSSRAAHTDHYSIPCPGGPAKYNREVHNRG